MISAKSPYQIEYTNPQCKSVRVLLNNNIIATANSQNYIVDAYYHPNTGIILNAKGFDDYYAILNNSNIELWNCRNSNVTLVNVIPAGNVIDFSLTITADGIININLLNGTQTQTSTSLLSVLIELLRESGYYIDTKVLPTDITIDGINLQSSMNRDKIINDLCELLATDYLIFDNTVYFSPYNLSATPIYMEEQEHAFAVAYSIKQGSSNASYDWNAMGLRYIPNYNPQTLLDYKSELTSSNAESYIYDTAIVCSEDTAKTILANARVSKVYKMTARKKAVIATTPDYIRLQIGDYVALNGSFWLVTDLYFDKGKMEFHLEERAITADYPAPPIWSKPPINNPPPPPPPPLTRINVMMITGLVDSTAIPLQAPLYIYIEPRVELNYYLDNVSFNGNLAYLRALLVDVPACTANIATLEPILDNTLSGFALVDNEIIYFRNGCVRSRSYFDTNNSLHSANTDTYTVAKPSKVDAGTHTLIANSSNDLYTMINATLNSQPTAIRTETYTTFGGQVAMQINPNKWSKI
jgi:hypothetical protein